eukprot:TRINITY_DN541_c0_g1_i1.p1 TRINITY_DN541_c0_g1~~TRINITY_DN541_c0_g1_i1.p1  ORF type:complete len:474 (-),score=112.52 TRINITY_DN541_c0_g1_i1:16-1437(-)
MATPPGPYLYTLKLKFGPLEAEYSPTVPSQTQKEAKQNAVLLFVNDPPSWLRDIFDGKIPEGYSVDDNEPQGTFQPKQEVVDKDKPEPKSQEKPKLQDILPKFPQFSFSQFDLDRQSSSNFIDVFGDDQLVIQVLNEGSSYPDTDGALNIKYCIKRESDGEVIEADLTRKFKPNEPDMAELFSWGSTFMKVGGEVIVRSSHVFGYGECGVPPIVPPRESLLAYIHLISADPYIPPSEDEDTIDKIMLLASKLKEQGNCFTKRDLLKFALDNYVRAIRLLQRSVKGYKKVPGGKRTKLFHLINSLYTNISLVYEKLGDTEAVKDYCTKSIETLVATPKVYLRRAKVYINEQKFQHAIEDINSAKKLIYVDDIDPVLQKNYFGEINKVKQALTRKVALYEEKKRKMEVRMSSILTPEPKEDAKTEAQEEEQEVEVTTTKKNVQYSDDSSDDEDYVFIGTEMYKLSDILPEVLAQK